MVTKSNKQPVKMQQLLTSILTISVLGFGGGAAVIPLFHKEVIEKYKWMSNDEFQDMLSVANALPGPIQTKLAGYIGYKLKGIIGLLLSLLCIILPSLLIMLVFFNTINFFKDKDWVQGAIGSVFPVVTIMMLLLTWNFFKKSHKALRWLNNLILILISLISIIILNINPAVIIIIILIAVFIPKLSDIQRFIVISLMISIFYLLLKFEVFSLLFGLFLNQNGSVESLPTLLKVFFAFFIPGIIGYGGGPGSLSLIAYEVVDHFKLIVSEQFTLAVAIQGALPGVTATKLAGTIGYQAAGFWGLLVGVLVYVTPSMILMVSLLKLLNKYKSSPVVKRLTSYVGPVIIVLLGTLTYNFFINSINNIGWIETPILLLTSFLLLKQFKVHPFIVIFLTMTIGALITLI